MVLLSRSVSWMLFFVAVAFTFLVFIDDVGARSKMVTNVNPVQAPIFSTNVSIAPTCDLNYSDITAGVMQRMMSSQNFSNGVISSSPLKVDDRRFIFKVYDPNVVLVKYFLYDVGVDLLWDTNDDLVYFLTNTSPANYELLGMTSSNGNIIKFYWALHNLQNPGGFNIYSCILNSGICNSSLVSFIADPLFVTGMVPFEYNGILFFAVYLSESSFPLGSQVNKRSTFSIPGLLFFFRNRPNSLVTEVSLLDTFNNITSVIYTDNSSIQPHIFSFLRNSLVTVYSKSNPISYSHFIKFGSSSEKELFNGPWTGPLYEPFSIQFDGKIVWLNTAV